MSNIQSEYSVPSIKELRVFNIIWCVIFTVVGLLPLIKGGSVRIWSISLSLFFFAVATVYPKCTILFFRVWVKFGAFIGNVNAKIIMSIIFYAVITPIGVIIRLFGYDPLSRKIDKSAVTYFEDREVSHSSMKNQF